MTDLPGIFTYEDVERWWAAESTRLRAEGLARMEELLLRDRIPDGVAEFIRSECARALDEKVREGFEMLRAMRARELDPAMIH